MTRFVLILASLLAAIPTLLGAAVALPPDQVVLNPIDKLKHEGAQNDIRDALIAAEIIPTVIDDFEPAFVLDVEWKKKEAKLGNTLKVKKMKKEPKVSLRFMEIDSLKNCSSGMTYTVALTDPDAPSHDNPKWGEMCHYIATGITLSTHDGKTCEMELSSHKDIMPYKPPGPPPKTGMHRYVFLMFAPANGTVAPIHPTKPEHRKHWGTGLKGHGVRDWAYANGLIPVAANFVYAENKKQ